MESLYKHRRESYLWKEYILRFLPSSKIGRGCPTNEGVSEWYGKGVPSCNQRVKLIQTTHKKNKAICQSVFNYIFFHNSLLCLGPSVPPSQRHGPLEELTPCSYSLLYEQTTDVTNQATNERPPFHEIYCLRVTFLSFSSLPAASCPHSSITQRKPSPHRYVGECFVKLFLNHKYRWAGR